jgi:hypothetical protein
MRWFASAQCTVNGSWSHNQVSGSLQSADTDYNPTLLPYQDRFNQVDANLSWKFNQSRGLLIAGVRNAANTRFQYTEIDKLNPRFSIGRQMYAKVKLAW